MYGDEEECPVPSNLLSPPKPAADAEADGVKLVEAAATDNTV